MVQRRLEMDIHGRVQGVGFRWYAEGLARELGLTGYVRNMPHGDVEFVAEGDEERLERARSGLMRGPALARVSGADVRLDDATGEFSDFRIRF